jgi:hypothetical protein
MSKLLSLLFFLFLSNSSFGQYSGGSYAIYYGGNSGGHYSQHYRGNHGSHDPGGASVNPWTDFTDPSVREFWENGFRGVPVSPEHRRQVSEFLESSNHFQEANTQIKEEVSKIIDYFSTTGAEKDRIKDFIPPELRITPLPEGVSKEKLDKIMDPVWDATRSKDVLGAAESVDEIISTLDKLSPAEKGYIQSELNRLFTAPSGQMKDLPYVANSSVTFSASLDSPSLKPYVKAINFQRGFDSEYRGKVIELHEGKKLSPGSMLRLKRQELQSNDVKEALQIEEFKEHYFGENSDFPEEAARSFDELGNQLEDIQNEEDLRSFDDDKESAQAYDKAREIIKKNKRIHKETPSTAFTPDEKSFERAAELSLCLERGEVCPSSSPVEGASPEVKNLHDKMDRLHNSFAKSQDIPDQDLKGISQGLISFGHQSVLNDDPESERIVGIATQATDMALGLTPIVGTVKDLFELVKGENLLTGEELSTGERAILAASVAVDFATVGVGGRITKTVLTNGLKNLDKLVHSPFLKESTHFLKRNWMGFKVFGEAVFKNAEALGIQNIATLKSYARIAYAHMTLPSNLKIVGIKSGTDPTKIAIIGRKMQGGVLEVADHFKSKGAKVETFNWSSEAEDRFYELANSYPNRIIPYKKVLETQAYAENRAWAERLVKEGYNVYDIRDPLMRNQIDGYSAFYDIETMTIWGELF